MSPTPALIGEFVTVGAGESAAGPSVAISIFRFANSTEPMAIALFAPTDALDFARQLIFTTRDVTPDGPPPPPVKEVDRLAHELAHANARLCIEAYCESRGPLGWDLSSVGPTAERFVDAAVRYLELRDLLHRNPHNEHFVRVLDPEACAFQPGETLDHTEATS